MINQNYKKSNKIENNRELLDLIIDGELNSGNKFSKYGYWSKIKKAGLNGIKEFGLEDFRGINNPSATSYGDNQCLDLRLGLNYGYLKILKWILTYLYPFNKIFNSQVERGKSYYERLIKYRSKLIEKDKRVIKLVNEYNINFDTLRGGCHSYSKFKDVYLSHHYIEKLNTINFISKKIDLISKNTLFEIGGGFGVFTHLAIEIFNIKKIIFLEISPTLYVATQYLKSFYGNRVFDYSETRFKNKIKFSNNNDLEIYCILPHQINLIESEIDFFHNAHSFSVMPENTVIEYLSFIKKILKKDGDIVLLENPTVIEQTKYKLHNLIGTFFSGFNTKSLKNKSLFERELADQYIFIKKNLSK